MSHQQQLQETRSSKEPSATTAGNQKQLEAISSNCRKQQQLETIDSN
jgi:hypothetical protein